MMRNKKRGISPLIASVLLIGFTIAIVAMIFIWWGDFVKQKAIKDSLKNDAERACVSEVDLDVKSAKIVGESLEFVINNRGSQKISGFRFRIKDVDGISMVLVPKDIGAVSQGKVPVSKKDKDGKDNYGDNPREAEILPIIKKDSEEGSLAYTCTNQIIKIKIQGGE